MGSRLDLLGDLRGLGYVGNSRQWYIQSGGLSSWSW